MSVVKNSLLSGILANVVVGLRVGAFRFPELVTKSNEEDIAGPCEPPESPATEVTQDRWSDLSELDEFPVSPGSQGSAGTTFVGGPDEMLDQLGVTEDQLFAAWKPGEVSEQGEARVGASPVPAVAPSVGQLEAGVPEEQQIVQLVAGVPEDLQSFIGSLKSDATSIADGDNFLKMIAFLKRDANSFDNLPPNQKIVFLSTLNKKSKLVRAPTAPPTNVAPGKQSRKRPRKERDHFCDQSTFDEITKNIRPSNDASTKSNRGVDWGAFLAYLNGHPLKINWLKEIASRTNLGTCQPRGKKPKQQQEVTKYKPQEANE